MSFITLFNYVILVYFIVMELQLLFVSVVSFFALRRDRFTSMHGRLHDMLTSDTTPPVSIIIPAYNEAVGIVESVRSTAMLKYTRKEIIVVNDGSSDETVKRLIDEFRMEPVDVPFRPSLETEPVHRVYKSRLPLPIVLVDKENGGKGDAINAGINIARYPYVMATDADMVLDDECLLRAVRHFVEDRSRTIAVGGNVRPLNGCEVRRGRVTNVSLPRRPVELAQVVEYIRSFLSARPGWSALNSLLIVSGAFGIFQKQAIIDVGGFRHGHLGEDMELTMRLHRQYRRNRIPYRIVYAPDAVAWTEVPLSRRVLRRQRIRWHRGLMQVIWQYKSMLFNPRYGVVGLLGWPIFVAFEFLAPIVEFIGWLVVPASFALGFLNWEIAIPLLMISLVLGVGNSLIGIFLDERFGYYNAPSDAAKLLAYSLGEQLGMRQQTVWWRVRAMFWNRRRKAWGDMQRAGVGNLASEKGSV